MADAMEVEPDVDLIASVMAAGGADLKKCMQCSTCTCVCSLSTQEDGFPRKQILHAQWGLKEKLLADVGPWLCHYCGECSQNCPREANPGEAMMALRRYLTAQYDWTGLSRLMYRHEGWNIGALLGGGPGGGAAVYAAAQLRFRSAAPVGPGAAFAP